MAYSFDTKALENLMGKSGYSKPVAPTTPAPVLGGGFALNKSYGLIPRGPESFSSGPGPGSYEPRISTEASAYKARYGTDLPGGVASYLLNAFDYGYKGMEWLKPIDYDSLTSELDKFKTASTEYQTQQQTYTTNLNAWYDIANIVAGRVFGHIARGSAPNQSSYQVNLTQPLTHLQRKEG